jgi:hypothetical protein
MLTRREAAELALGEYLLGLDGLGLGGKGEAIWRRMMVREVRPVLLRQRAMLDKGIRAGADVDAEVAGLEDEVAAAYERCLEQLTALWLTEGPAAKGEDAA